MFKVGLTGNYYSGQTEISQVFDDMEVPVFDANLLVRFLVNHSKKHINLIKKEFGSEIYQIGLLDVKKFNDNPKFEKLLTILENDIVKQYINFCHKHKDYPYTMFLYNFIFERNLQSSFDYIVNCFRPKHHRRSDLLLLTSLSEFTIKKILDNEMDEYQKNNLSDFTIQNYNRTGPINADVIIGLENQILRVHKQITNKITYSDFI
jgi:dephospho-CoA kinase